MERWPKTLLFDNVEQIEEHDLAHLGIDTLIGGFPCQPHSIAGKRRGASDERYLWPQMSRLVRALRPDWLVAENVPGIRGTVADEVLADLEAANYKVWPLVVGACHAGAPHRRQRVFFVAMADAKQSRLERHRTNAGQSAFSQPWNDGASSGVELVNSLSVHSSGRSRTAATAAIGSKDTSRRERVWSDSATAVVADAEGLADASNGRCEQRTRETVSEEDERRGRELADRDHRLRQYQWPARPGEQQYEWEETRLFTPEVGSSANGLSERLVRNLNRFALSAYGNAVVPQVGEMIARSILNTEEMLGI